MNVNDTIKCKDKDDVIETMTALAKEGIETKFVYFEDGSVGLTVISITNLKTRKNKKLLKMAEELKNACLEREQCVGCPFAYGGYYCYFHGDNPTGWRTDDIFEEEK